MHFERLRWLLLRAVARILLPQARIVFGYLAEDLIAARLLGTHNRRGIYVDIGCNDPWLLSNTFLLRMAGWRGVNIDANPAVIDRMTRARPEDKNICALVGEPGAQRRFLVFADDARSTADPDFAQRLAQGERPVRELLLEPRGLDDLLAEAAAPDEPEFLNIDVEGLELEILRTLNLGRYRFGLIAVEIHGLNLGEPGRHPVVQHLQSNGYGLVAHNALTAFFGRLQAGARSIPGL